MNGNYLELDFIVTHTTAGNTCYADDKHIRLVTSGPVALFSKKGLSKSSGKGTEEIDSAHNKYLL